MKTKQPTPLYAEIAAFCERTGLSETAFGLAAMNDKAFCHSLKKGRRVLTDTDAKVRQFMQDYGAGQKQEAA